MEVIQNKNWFQRNWLWAVPIGGCGCGCLVIVLIFVFGIGATFFGIDALLDKVSNTIENTEPVVYAKQRAFNHPEVIDYLGENLETYGMISGKISFQNANGSVDITIPIKGSIRTASIIVKGIKVDGVWIYEDLYVNIMGKQLQINLLEKNLEPI